MPEPIDITAVDPTWRVVGVSVAGAHRRAGEECQDANAYQARGETLALAVADGAGDAMSSGTGARLAVGAAVECMGKDLPPDIWVTESVSRSFLRSAIHAALLSIENESQLANIDRHEYSTTLTLALISEAGVAVAQVGDGTVVARADDGQIVALSWPDNGKYVNETFFITSPNLEEHIHYSWQLGRFTHVAAITDGLRYIALDLAAHRPFYGFFDPLFSFAARLSGADTGQDRIASFLRSPRVTARTGDDLTLVLASRTM